MPDEYADERFPRQIGRYQLLAPVGGGGMGDVYRAYDPVEKRELALKILKHTYPRAQYYFKREFRAVVRLRHPNLVRLHDLYQVDEGKYFFTMELIEGQDLYSYVSGHDHLVEPAQLRDPARLVRLRSSIVQLLQALAFLHSKDHVHRDIKPSNVLVDRQGVVKLVDFGIVKELLPGREGESLSQVFGTCTYYSPEQSMGGHVNTAADLYSVGVVLYELLAGTPPFEGSNTLDVARRHREEAPVPLTERVPGVDPQLAQVCMMLLHKEPEGRPSACQTLTLLGERCTSDLGDEGGIVRFVGRRQERKLLHQCLHDVQRGQGRIVVLEGSSGIGKSALVEAFRNEAHVLGASFFMGRCVHRDHVPLRGLDTAIERLTEAYRIDAAAALNAQSPQMRGGLIAGFSFLGELLKSEHHGPKGEPPGPGLRHYIDTLAKGRCLVIVVEHLHLADDATVDALEELQMGGGLPPILLILTARPEAAEKKARVRSFLELLDGHPMAVRLSIGPFSLDESYELVQEHRAQLPDSFALRLPELAAHIHAQSEGVPLFVAQMISGFLQTLPEVWPTFEEEILRRVGQMPKRTQLLLQVLSLCQRPPTGEVLKLVCELDATLLDDALDLLERENFTRVEVDQDGGLDVVPINARLMEIVRAHIDVLVRRQLHGRLATNYQLASGAVSEIRFHSQAAGDLNAAIAYAQGMAQLEYEAKNFSRAADLYALALEGHVPDALSRVPLLVMLSDALAYSARYVEALHALEQLAELSPEEGKRWQARHSQLYLMAGQLADFYRLADALPENARELMAGLLLPLDPGRAELLLGAIDTGLARLVRARLLAGSHSRHAILQAKALVDSVKHYGDSAKLHQRVAYAMARAQVLRALGKATQALELVQRARRLLQPGETDHTLMDLSLLLLEAELFLLLGRVREARGIGRQLLYLTRTRGLMGLRVRSAMIQARVHLEAGEPEAAARLVEEGERIWPPLPLAMPQLSHALLRVRQAFYEGELGLAEELIQSLRKDELLLPFLARREPGRACALLNMRIAMTRALRLWAAGQREALTQARQQLYERRVALGNALPSPEDWLLVADIVIDLCGEYYDEAEHKLKQAFLEPDAYLNNLQVRALLLMLQATLLRLRGLSPEKIHGQAQALLTEGAFKMPPEGVMLWG